MSEWDERKTRLLVRHWGKMPPWQVAARIYPKKTSAAVIAKARELGLPDFVRNRPEAMPRRKEDRPAVEPIQIKEGYVEIAPGHMADLKSYRLILKASGLHV